MNYHRLEPLRRRICSGKVLICPSEQIETKVRKRGIFFTGWRHNNSHSFKNRNGINRSSRSRSRYSLSIKLSMRFLMKAGSGTKREDSCRVTSAIRSLCRIVFRAFMMRTMDASTRCRRSSSTGAGIKPAALAALPSLADTRGILTRFNLLVKDSLKVNTSSSAISLPLWDFLRIRYLGVQRLMRCRFSSGSGIDNSRISSSVIASRRLKSMRIHI
mmetsp:Transcript_16823/g.22612  ORF Transcript_16823/g.22612 Transcript_16823/m.22612 type:complete len:216 (+) Transcript_16823:375-1022(+)